MPKYEIKQFETHVRTYIVDADNKADALESLLTKENKPIGSPVFYEVNYDIGLSNEEVGQSVIEQLRDRGLKHYCKEGYIESIDSITKLEDEK